jgi:perosamine synthetase
VIPRFEPTAGVGETAAFLADLMRWGGAGDAVARFEEEFARRQGGGHALFVPSGRLGLWLVLRALDYPPGSEVVLPAFTYFAMPAAVLAAGLTPVYADVDPATYELTPASVRAVLTPRTRAVVPTHLFGLTCPLPELRDICAPAGIDLVEDCAQSFGATVAGVKAGSFGRAAAFTFGITKNFTTYSGGMVTCRDAALHRRMVGMRDGFRAAARGRLVKEGITALAMRVATLRPVFNLCLAPLLARAAADRPDFIHRAFEEHPRLIDEQALTRLSWRPGDAQARAGLRQLAALDGKNESRRRRGTELLAALGDLGCGGLPAPAPAGLDHIYMSFAVTRPDRHRFAALLRRLGVDTSPGYMSDCSSLPGFGGKPGSCPGAAAVERDILHLPLYPGLSSRDVGRIAAAVAEADRRMASGRPA